MFPESNSDSSFPTSASGSVLLKQITVLDAIYWLYSAWNNVLESTVTKCFKRCGFGLDEITSENSHTTEIITITFLDHIKLIDR
jgi:hypothetical protein